MTINEGKIPELVEEEEKKEEISHEIEFQEAPIELIEIAPKKLKKKQKKL